MNNYHPAYSLVRSIRPLARQVKCAVILIGLLITASAFGASAEVGKDPLAPFSQTSDYPAINNHSGKKLSLSLPNASHSSRSLQTVPSGIAPCPKVKTTTISSYPQTHFQRGKYLLQIGRVDDALIEFLKATQENPRLVQAFYEQALIFRERGYLRLAESALDQALVVKPDYQKARVLRATIRLQQGNLNGAVSELSMSLGLSTNQVPRTTDPSAASNASQANIQPQRQRFPAVMQTPHTQLPVVEQFTTTRFSYPSQSKSSNFLAGDDIRDNRVEHFPESSQQMHPEHRTTSSSHEILEASPQPYQPNPKLGTNRADGTQEAPHPSVRISKPATSQSNSTTNQLVPSPIAKNTGSPMHFRFFHPIRFLKTLWASSTAEVHANIHVTQTSQAQTKSTKQMKHQRKHSKLTGWLFRYFDTTSNNTPAQKPSSHVSTTTTKISRPSSTPPVIKPNQNTQEQLSMVIHQPTGQISTKIYTNPPSRNFYAPQQDGLPTQLSQPMPVPRQIVSSVRPKQRAGNLTFSQDSPSPMNNSHLNNGGTTFGTPSFSSSNERLLTLAQMEKLPAAYLQNKHTMTADNLKLGARQDQAACDPMISRLTYLKEHGTASLKRGEAFMFSEETGEAVLFLTDGQTIRRKIAQAQDPVEVVKSRRPDIAFPQELKYNLSLLAKLLPPQKELQPEPRPPGKFTVNELLAEPSGFWSWLRSMLKI